MNIHCHKGHVPNWCIGNALPTYFFVYYWKLTTNRVQYWKHTVTVQIKMSCKNAVTRTKYEEEKNCSPLAMNVSTVKHCNPTNKRGQYGKPTVSFFLFIFIFFFYIQTGLNLLVNIAINCECAVTKRLREEESHFLIILLMHLVFEITVIWIWSSLVFLEI